MRDGKWSGNRLKQAVNMIDGEGFWRTERGGALIAQFADHLSPTVARVVQRTSGYELDQVEVTHAVVVALTLSAAARKGICAAEDPWAYLYTCSERWMNKEAGQVRAAGLDEVPDIAAHYTLEDGVDPAHGYTPLHEVIAKTVKVLLPLVDHSQPELAAALEWFAQNAERRQGHGLAEAQCDPYLVGQLGLGARQIAAVANIAWGSRPAETRAKSSLFAGFLTDPDFDPTTSRTHLAALQTFRVGFSKITTRDTTA